MLKEKQAEQEVKPQTETSFMQEPKLTEDLKLFDRWDRSLFFWQYYRADKHQSCFSTLQPKATFTNVKVLLY